MHLFELWFRHHYIAFHCHKNSLLFEYLYLWQLVLICFIFIHVLVLLCDVILVLDLTFEVMEVVLYD